MFLNLFWTYIRHCSEHPWKPSISEQTGNVYQTHHRLHSPPCIILVIRGIIIHFEKDWSRNPLFPSLCILRQTWHTDFYKPNICLIFLLTFQRAFTPIFTLFTVWHKVSHSQSPQPKSVSWDSLMILASPGALFPGSTWLLELAETPTKVPSIFSCIPEAFFWNLCLSFPQFPFKVVTSLQQPVSIYLVRAGKPQGTPAHSRSSQAHYTSHFVFPNSFKKSQTCLLG